MRRDGTVAEVHYIPYTFTTDERICDGFYYASAFKLLAEHEMGELFKVIGLATPGHGPALGFSAGDRTHRL